MPELLEFQDAFVAAIGGERSALSPWLARGTGEAGLSVYRNTIAKGCVDALAANFPTVLSMVGEDWFRAAAALFAREAPPPHAALLDYGEGFPAWLGRFPPAQDTPYLVGVAHLDRLRTESLFAAEAPVLTADALAALPPEALAKTRLRLHPSVRFAAFDAGLPSLWAAARAGREDLELSETPEALLFIRASHCVIGEAETEFLRACRDGQTLTQAAERAGDDVASIFARLIADGAFMDLSQ